MVNSNGKSRLTLVQVSARRNCRRVTTYRTRWQHVTLRRSFISSRLTLSCNEALEVDSDSHPHGLAVFFGPEAPHADVHGLGPWLGRQAREEKGLLGEVVRLPATALVCGEPGDRKFAAGA